MFRVVSFVMFGIHRSLHARALLRHLLAAGLRPMYALVSAEIPEHNACSQPFWDRPQWWVDPAEDLVQAHARVLEQRPVDDSIAQAYAEAGVPFLFVPGFFDAVTRRLLGAGQADTMVLAEGPILRGPILDLFSQGIVNLHAAPLPAYRGNFATGWALYHDEPLEACAHLVAPGIDDGPLLGRRRLPVLRGDTLADIDGRSLNVCGELLADVLQRAMHEGIEPQPQAAWQGRTFRGRMPADIIAECERRLSQQEYSHYA